MGLSSIDAFIREHADAPFFCYLPFTIPHLALQVPDATLQQYAGLWEETPYTGRSYLPHDTPRAAYAAMITHMDASVGRLLDLLAELDLEEDTLVLFASDNGVTHLGPDQVDFEFFDSSAGLRGFKGSVWEGGIRVPLIARMPGRIAAGTVSEHVSAFQDYLPTLADLARAPVPEGVDGNTLWNGTKGSSPWRMCRLVPVARRLGCSPRMRASVPSTASSISSASVARKAGSSKP